MSSEEKPVEVSRETVRELIEMFRDPGFRVRFIKGMVDCISQLLEENELLTARRKEALRSVEEKRTQIRRQNMKIERLINVGVSRWHEDNSTSLRVEEWLGVSEEEYAKFVEGRPLCGE